MTVFAALTLAAGGAAQAQPVMPPAAATLYAQMTAAMQAAGSVHVKVSTAALPAGPQQSIRQSLAGSLDVSASQQILHGVFSSRYTSVRNHKVLLAQRSEFVGVDGHTAQRDDGGRWVCQSVPADARADAYTLTQFSFLPTTPHFIGGVTAAIVRNISVWRVTIDLGNRIDTLNIAQADSRIVRVTEVRGSKNAADGQIKTYTDYSRYGEWVTAQLPAACQ